MSFYRTLLAAVAAVAIASPVFADDTTATTQGTTENILAAQTNESSSATTTTTEAKVNINKADAKELMKIKGMNASKARTIVAYRKQHGDFKSTDDLSHVKGFKRMKPDMLKEITDQLITE